MRIQLVHTLEDIISVDNLLEAWREFIRGKRAKRDVQEFQLGLMDNVLSLQRDLASGTYRHGGYQAFSIFDPKLRRIHKASVRDRLTHHAIYRMLYPFFDRTFIADSFSCRIGRGTHKALNQFRTFGRMVSRNNTRTCWVLKCDIRKFFASIDHDALSRILGVYIPDVHVMQLLEKVIRSFATDGALGKGLPLGNLTSQLFANVYMNEFDQFVKHRFKAKHYIRYADDFVIFSHDRGELERLLPRIGTFLRERLNLALHPDKVFIKTLASGVDFLGWVHFPDHRVLRSATKKRMMKRIAQVEKQETINSYLGLLRHGNAYKMSEEVRKYGLIAFPKMRAV